MIIISWKFLFYKLIEKSFAAVFELLLHVLENRLKKKLLHYSYYFKIKSIVQ